MDALLVHCEPSQLRSGLPRRQRVHRRRGDAPSCAETCESACAPSEDSMISCNSLGMAGKYRLPDSACAYAQGGAMPRAMFTRMRAWRLFPVAFAETTSKPSLNSPSKERTDAAAALS